VVFAGQVSEEDLPRYYAVGDVFAMPCRTRLRGLEVEGWGNVFIEAAACGKPVVVGDSGGAPDAVRDGETGYLVDGRDTAAVAARLVTLLRDPDLRARMGAAGRAWVEAEWRWDVLAGRLRHLLDG
jgi:phosphatidylinositol alpha-1,6-mannosyltransferase